MPNERLQPTVCRGSVIRLLKARWSRHAAAEASVISVKDAKVENDR